MHDVKIGIEVSRNRWIWMSGFNQNQIFFSYGKRFFSTHLN